MGESTESAEDREWSIGRAAQDADTWLRGIGALRQRKPTGVGEEYSFPTDVRALTSEQLGTLALKLGAWATYLAGVLGNEAAELEAFETVYEIQLGVAMQEFSRTMDSRRIVKDVLRALAIKHDPTLDKLTKALIGRRLRIRKLEAQVKIFTDQKATLSREQSRREPESRLT